GRCVFGSGTGTVDGRPLLPPCVYRSDYTGRTGAVAAGRNPVQGTPAAPALCSVAINPLSGVCMIQIGEIDHVVLRTIDMDTMRSFYCDVLGCHEERRQDEI